MTKLTITAYDYWKSCDRDGFVTVEKYFSTPEKAKEWMEKHPNYIFRGINSEHTEARRSYEKPTFSMTEIVVDEE